MVYEDVWGSIVKFVLDIKQDIIMANPSFQLAFTDLEAHANIAELPNSDIIGPVAVSITESTQNMFELSFAVGASTYTHDTNLFRQRSIVSHIFERMRPMQKFVIYKAGTLDPIGFCVMTDGTLMAPMSKADARPWQYVQGTGLIDPASV